MKRLVPATLQSRCQAVGHQGEVEVSAGSAERSRVLDQGLEAVERDLARLMQQALDEGALAAVAAAARHHPKQVGHQK